MSVSLPSAAQNCEAVMLSLCAWSTGTAGAKCEQQSVHSCMHCVCQWC